MKRLLHTPLALLLRRIVLLYAVLMLCRVVFYLYNAQLLGTIGRGELWQLLAGSLKFDTVSVIYANGVFILLALLPLHVRERGWYRKLMYWYYVAVNAVLVVAVNMSDCVYFRYTQKRFTADEVFFADNSNSVQLVGKFMAENWYLVLVAAALVALLAWGYGRKVREESLLSRGWAYYVGSTVIFATGAGLSIAGMRGGLCFKRMYANGTRSIQAMPSVLGSIPSFRTPFVLMPQSLGESRQLPAILRGRGYSTAFFCGSEHGSMGFGAYARSAGVERLVSREDYEDRHGKGDFDGYWGIWDEPFLQFTGEELSRTPEPFFATLFTLSSHHPFVVPAQYEDKLPAGYTKLHKGVAYVDNAFRLFFERFGSEEWFRRTIFVFVADHVSSEKFAAETRSYPGNYHIIGFMYTPDGALRGQVGEVVQQLDIMPTLLGLLGNTESYFAFGRDVLNEPQRQQWSVSWDGAFQAVTNDGTIRFDDAQDKPEASGAGDSLLQDFRALVQQYYSHAEKKSYIVHD